MSEELPELVAQEIEILRDSRFAELPVCKRFQLLQKKIGDDEENPAICCLEVDLEPMTEEGIQLVCATLQVRIPAGYPTSATPKVFVERSRGIGDVATEAMMEAAEKAVQHHGLQEEGCLAPLLSEVKDALGKAVSECYICMMDCDPSSAIFVACNCVFHRDCLEEWRGLKDREKTAKADAATESIKSQKDALEKMCAEANEQVEEADKQVAYAQLQMDRAASAVEQAMKKAQATAEDDEEQVPSEDEANEQEAEESDSSVELDSVDYRNEARWGAPEVSLGGLYHNKHTKKNWHPSVRMNRKRPKKYLKRIDEKLEEMKKEGKRQLSDEMSQAVTKWEKAQFEHKETKLILDKEQENYKKLKEKAEKLQGELEWTSNYLSEERAKFTSLPLLCPVCQNEVDAKVEEKQPEAAESVQPQPVPENVEDQEEIARQALLAEEEKKRQKAAAELAALEEKMVFMMTKGAKGPKESEDTDAAAAAEVEQTPVDDTEEQELQEDDVKSYMPSGDDLPPPRKALDDELLVTIEMLMEAYSEKTVEGQELLEPFNELLEVLRDSQEKTDQEIKEVLTEVIGVIREEESC
ncbi:unnamed protein product [Cladocopium goreaui]|uniref:RING-type domain-containing protein n=1 Tax=Cladocopium goreaui TaxID=2562237 RepID=A0A9P1D7K3_9DINO|nr:unnamed protein product [Cladocopium goreaui]